MKKILIALLPLIYYCVKPLNHDKARIKKGENFYSGFEGFYTKSYSDFRSYGIIGTIGAYYGLSENLALGVEVSAGSESYEESKTWFWPLFHGYGFIKFSYPFSYYILSIKGGAGYPDRLKLGILLGIPDTEKFTISYFRYYPNLNLFSLSIQMTKNAFLSTGFIFYISSIYYLVSFKLGISLRN
ncbi:MAG: hypothetical protein ABDH37_07005 [Candidatus Hydrothermales bacterium]